MDKQFQRKLAAWSPVPLAFTTEAGSYHTWCPQRGSLQFRPLSRASRREVYLVFHEIAHWCIASSAQLRHPEFGLGTDPGANKAAKRIVSYSLSNRIESQAFLLQHFLLWSFLRKYPEYLDFFKPILRDQNRDEVQPKLLVKHNWEDLYEEYLEFYARNGSALRDLPELEFALTYERSELVRLRKSIKPQMAAVVRVRKRLAAARKAEAKALAFFKAP